MLKAPARHAAGNEKLFQHSFLRDSAALKLRGQNGFSCHATSFEYTWPHVLLRSLALFGLLRHHRLAGLMTEHKFLLVPRRSRYRRAQLLIEPVALSRELADREFGIQHLGAGEIAAREMLRLGPAPAQRRGLEKRARDRLACHC